MNDLERGFNEPGSWRLFGSDRHGTYKPDRNNDLCIEICGTDLKAISTAIKLYQEIKKNRL